MARTVGPRRAVSERKLQDALVRAPNNAGMTYAAESFADAGVLTGNEGLVLALDNGQEFQGHHRREHAPLRRPTGGTAMIDGEIMKADRAARDGEALAEHARLVEAYRRAKVPVWDLPYTTTMAVVAGMAGYPGDREGLGLCWRALLRLHRAGRLPPVRAAETVKEIQA